MQKKIGMLQRVSRFFFCIVFELGVLWLLLQYRPWGWTASRWIHLFLHILLCLAVWTLWRDSYPLFQECMFVSVAAVTALLVFVIIDKWVLKGVLVGAIVLFIGKLISPVATVIAKFLMGIVGTWGLGEIFNRVSVPSLTLILHLILFWIDKALRSRKLPEQRKVPYE